ncbi:MAG: two-component system sensor histidine kinase/response regulator [Polaribacter sp.]|jgi:two-component system sensor histidine kinase/response regulator
MLLKILDAPVLDGYSATQVIRNEMPLKKLPIIALSANVMSEDSNKSLASGMYAHIGKPINVELLVSSMASYL